MAQTEPIRHLLLALADDELIMGHRHSEWTGWAPHIEEDIAFSSIAQDEIGHANLFYNLIAQLDGSDPDELALGRQKAGYRHAIFCERPNGDWAYTLARHFLYEIAERVRLDSLASSSFKPLAEASEKVSREEKYHELHSNAWFDRLAAGPVEARHQLAVALSSALPEGTGLFEPIEGEEEAVELGVMGAPSSELMQRWLSEAVGRIEAAGIPFDLAPDELEGELLPTSSGEMLAGGVHHQEPARIDRQDGRFVLSGSFPGWGGRRGTRSHDFDALWDDLTKTYREAPTATW